MSTIRFDLDRTVHVIKLPGGERLGDSRELVRLTLTQDDRLVWIGAAPARAAGC